jgi:KUP system potassium uptake protein
MLMTTALLFIAMREIWGWGLALAGGIAGVFAVVDASFFIANLAKIADGGYVPLILAAIVYGVMTIWHIGTRAVVAQVQELAMPVDTFMAEVVDGKVPRVPGTAVFLTRTTRGAPPVMVWHLKHNRALHERLVALTIVTESVPWVHWPGSLTMEEEVPGFWRITARFGFMDRPDIPALLAHARERGCGIHLSDVTYYVGHETVTHRADGKALPRWVEGIYATMQRNAAHLIDYFQLPEDQVVELGRQVAI